MKINSSNQSEKIIQLEIQIEHSKKIKFIEIYNGIDMIKRLNLKKRPILSYLFPFKKKIIISLNNSALQDNALIEVWGFSKLSGYHKCGEHNLEIKNTSSEVQIDANSKLKPLIFTSLGRSGTTLLMNLLANFDEIIADKKYPLENKFASDSIRDCYTSDDFYTQEKCFLNKTKKNIEIHFTDLAKVQDKNHVNYFLEKNLSPIILIDELYGQSKKIFLVRDFRSIIFSSLRFNKKRGYDRFGREFVNDNKDFIKFKAQQAYKWLYEPYSRYSSKSLLIKYEDLIDNPLNELSRICYYLNISKSDVELKKIKIETKKDSSRYSFHKTSNESQDIESNVELNRLIEKEFKYLLEEFNYTL